MKLKLLAEAETSTKGTYVGAKFSDETNDRLEKFIKKHNIKNPLDPEHFHTTLIYSRKYLPDFKARGELQPPLIGTPKKFDIFKSRTDTNCLVLIYDSKEMVARHNQIMKEFEATYDFPKYVCHITLSYDCGDVDIDDLGSHIHEIGDIEITYEYEEDLNLNWAIEKTRESNDD